MKFLIAAAFLVSCSSAQQLSESAKNLEIYSLKPAGCAVVGKLSAANEQGSKELATNQVMNEAAKLKASGIFVNQEVPNGKSITVHATAYKCD